MTEPGYIAKSWDKNLCNLLIWIFDVSPFGLTIKIKSSEVKKFQNGSQVESQNIKKVGKYLVFHEDSFLGLGEIDETFWIKPLKVLSERRII